MLSKNEINAFETECLGEVGGDISYVFTYKNKDSVIIREYVKPSCYSYNNANIVNAWYYLRPVSKAVEFAKYLAKKRKWILLLVEEVPSGQNALRIYPTDSKTHTTTSERRSSRCVGDISIFAGTPFG